MCPSRSSGTGSSCERSSTTRRRAPPRRFFNLPPELRARNPMLDKVLRTIDSRKDAAVSALSDFLRIPSVSTKPEHKADLRRCATWLADQLNAAGLRAEIRETGRSDV